MRGEEWGCVCREGWGGLGEKRRNEKGLNDSGLTVGLAGKWLRSGSPAERGWRRLPVGLINSTLGGCQGRAGVSGCSKRSLLPVRRWNWYNQLHSDPAFTETNFSRTRSPFIPLGDLNTAVGREGEKGWGEGGCRVWKRGTKDFLFERWLGELCKKSSLLFWLHSPSLSLYLCIFLSLSLSLLLLPSLADFLQLW